MATGRHDYEATVASMHEGQLAWCQGYLARYFRGGEALDTTDSVAMLADFG
ncbi:MULTISPECIES: hypothetical protein [Streptomyces]|uniref:hypothetical protein n=1 Tax=Streptomyces TaxID=1883 RepID=UPI00142DD82E|nr:MULTISPECIES: hypothetical protein [Streptomyces]